MMHMRWFLAIALACAPFAAQADLAPPTPLTDRRAPTVTLASTDDWRLSGVAMMDMEGSTLVLVVEGDVINGADRERATPTIRLGLRDKEGREFHSWTVRPSEPRVRPQDWAAFAARLKNPPENAHTVEIRTVDAN